MFSLTDIDSVRNDVKNTLAEVIKTQLNLYSYGSIYHIEQYNSMIKYLELYNFVLDVIYDILGDGLDYTDYSFTDEAITYLINKCREIIFYNN